MYGDRAVAEADVRISWHLQTPASMGLVKWLFHISVQQRQGNSAAPRPRCLQRNVSSVFESFSGRVAEVMHILSTWKTLGFKRPFLLAPTPPAVSKLLCYRDCWYIKTLAAILGFKCFIGITQPIFPLSLSYVTPQDRCKACRISSFHV